MNGLAEVNRKIADATYHDAQAVFAAIDDLAGAQSVSDAYEVYVAYLREQTNVGVARVQEAASFVKPGTPEVVVVKRDGKEVKLTVSPKTGL